VLAGDLVVKYPKEDHGMIELIFDSKSFDAVTILVGLFHAMLVSGYEHHHYNTNGESTNSYLIFTNKSYY
jgi:hypothetical protein